MPGLQVIGETLRVLLRLLGGRVGVFGGVVVNLVHARRAGEPPRIPEDIDLFWLRRAGKNEVRKIVQGYNERVGQLGLGDHALEENNDESLFYPGKLVYSTARGVRVEIVVSPPPAPIVQVEFPGGMRAPSVPLEWAVVTAVERGLYRPRPSELATSDFLLLDALKAIVDARMFPPGARLSPPPPWLPHTLEVLLTEGRELYEGEETFRLVRERYTLEDLVEKLARRLGPASLGDAESCRPASAPLRGAE